MAFKPFQKGSNTRAKASGPLGPAAPGAGFSKGDSSGAPPFAKKSTGKAAPVQKALMSNGRSMSGGGRC